LVSGISIAQENGFVIKLVVKSRKIDILVESSLLTGIMELLYEKYAVEIKDV
jgi:hypothetical protein